MKNRMATKTARSRRAAAAASCKQSAHRGKRNQGQGPLETGLAKITICASSFAWAHGKRCVGGFQRQRMSPIEFKDQLQMALHIYLRPVEGAAVADFFDLDGDGHVNGERFVRWFLKAGNDIRQERLRMKTAEQMEEMAALRAKQRQEETRRREANKDAIAVEFSPSDRSAALAALGRVALSYHDQRTGRESAKRDFACALAPDSLRLQLVRSFGIHLTDPQFAALFRVMDINGDGRIDGAEFLNFFFGLGNGERAKEHRQHEANCRARARNLKLDKLPPLTPALGR